MKIKDIINESTIPSPFYTEADAETDSMYNPQAVLVANKNREHYKDYFADFYSKGVAPVFEKSDNADVDPDLLEFTNKPIENERQSSGYRGQQRALERSGVPYDANVQPYDSAAYLTNSEVNY